MIFSSQIAVAASPADQLKSELDQLFDAPMWSNAHWGVKIVDLNSSEVLYERESTKGFMPASNMKLFTTAAALATLGPDFQYETNIYANGPISPSGTLKGDLIIAGTGDPSTSGRYSKDTSTTTMLDKWAKAVRSAGVKRITGDIIGDDDYFDDAARTGSWQIDYTQEWYAAESGGLAINDNCWDAVIRPGKAIGQPAKLEPVLPTKYVTFVNEVITTGPTKHPDQDPSIEIMRPLDSNVVTLKGEIPINVKENHQWGSVHNPTLFAATLLRDALTSNGIQVAGKPVDADDLKDKAKRVGAGTMKLLHTHVSPPLSRIIAMINKPSQNFYADQLLKTLGRHFYGKGSVNDGERVVRDFLTTAGANTRNLNMSDGSGLSRQNSVDPQMVIALLADMASRPTFKVFYDSLPIAGVDGTIKSRMKGTAAAGNVHAKTGFIGRVRALSGYVKDRDDHNLAFSMIANNYTVDTKNANATQDKVCELLANYSARAGEATAAKETTSTQEASTETTK